MIGRASIVPVTLAITAVILTALGASLNPSTGGGGLSSRLALRATCSLRRAAVCSGEPRRNDSVRWERPCV